MGDAKTERIRAAAERLFLADGLRATTMEAIAREAGVAKPTLYGRFSDKEVLFRAVATAFLERLKGLFDAALAGEGGAGERIARALAAKFIALNELLSTSPHADEILEAHARLGGGETAALFDWTCARVAAVLEQAGQPDATARAALVVAAADGVKEHAPRGTALADDVTFVVIRLLA